MLQFPNHTKFQLGDEVFKKSGSEWQGKVVGFYAMESNPQGYVVESLFHKGSAQIYPASALEKIVK